MNSSVPMVRQISWLATLPQFAAIVATMAIGHVLNGRDGSMWGVLAYLGYSIGSRLVIPRAHRAGIKLVRSNRFEEAISKFQESFNFFERHAWIDQFRSVVLMSPSAASYREMALANIGFCYAQIGNGQKSRLYYQKCLERFPDSGLAVAAIRMMDAAASSSRQ